MADIALQGTKISLEVRTQKIGGNYFGTWQILDLSQLLHQ